MRRDHRPYALKRLQAAIERRWVNHFTRPQLDSMGTPGMIMKPWHLHLYGKNISFGDQVHVVTSKDRSVRLTTWAHDNGSGRIDVGDFALLCPAVRIDAASSITVGPSTMLAAGVYLTDADWHDLYDRSRPIGQTAPIVLGENVWIGDSSIVCKGVSIGDNTIVGAGSVVTRSLPDNVIAAGNPAQVVRPLDSDRAIITRQDTLGRAGLDADLDLLDQSLRRDNTWLGWLSAMLRPGPDD